MQEKDMVNDILSMVNNSITGYANVISQSSNQQLRQTIQEIRNSCETFQYDLYKVAETKGYYKPATTANTTDVTEVRNQFSV